MTTRQAPPERLTWTRPDREEGCRLLGLLRDEALGDAERESGR
ncbi:hypothetical protein [Microbispora sp. GKU 823]|nr:hypothetical protein [Microbispora sp. GKU 823]